MQFLQFRPFSNCPVLQLYMYMTTQIANFLHNNLSYSKSICGYVSFTSSIFIFGCSGQLASTVSLNYKKKTLLFSKKKTRNQKYSTNESIPIFHHVALLCWFMLYMSYGLSPPTPPLKSLPLSFTNMPSPACLSDFSVNLSFFSL